MITVITHILLFFGIAGLVVPLFQRLKVSPVVGYLICGIVIGPFGLAQFSNHFPWVRYISIQHRETVEILGELGIIALLFMIGLELSLTRLRELGRFIFGLGLAQILLTAALVGFVAVQFGNNLQASILLGASMALSSTAIVMKLLEERRLLNRPVGALSFSILLMQDLAVVPILVLTSAFTNGGETNIVLALGSSVIIGIVTVGLIYWIGNKLLAPLFRTLANHNSPEWLAALVVFVAIGCAGLTYSAGLSLALGAFIAGLLIAETEFRHEVEVIINPLKSMLLGIFFLSIGMMVDIREVVTHPFLLTASVFGIFLLKSLVLWPLCLLFQIPARQAVEVSIYLAQPGEFALLILGAALASKMMPSSDVQFFLMVTVLAMMTTPLLFRLAPIAGSLTHRYFGKTAEEIPIHIVKQERTVVIAGFGRVGQLIAEVLEENHVPYIAFDHNVDRVQRFRAKNVSVFVGDARKKEFWKHLVQDHIEAAVIAIDDHHATKNILKSLRAEFPLLPVIIRSKDNTDLAQLYEEGATEVVAETVESSRRIAQLLLEKMKVKPKI